MRVFIACVFVAAFGAFVGYRVNEDRYGHYETTFGPFDSYGVVTAAKVTRRSAPAAASKTSPKVALPDGNVYDFGVMSPGDEGDHVFVVKNVGDDKMTLEIGATTCKCTLGDLGDNVLEPGEQTEVKLSWTVNSNEATFGQSAELRTNDPEQIAIRFEIKGQVVNQMQIVPETITFGEIAAGDTAEMEVRFYSYMNQDIAPGEVRFSSEEMNQLASFVVEEFTPPAEDVQHKTARQAFLVKATLKPGLKQGPVNQNLIFPFERLGRGSKEPERNADEVNVEAPASQETEETIDLAAAYVSVTGRIVGALSMLTNSKLRGVAGGGFVYEFGRLDADDPLTAKALITLKGSEHANTNLSVGSVSPAEHVSATLSEPIGKGNTKLFTLEMTLIPGESRVDRLGMNQEDYGLVTIESDNPKVPKMELRLKFSIPAR